MRSEFEKHYLSLDFYTKGSAQLCLDACTFDEKQDAYLPNMGWILENDADECVIYCCMLNTAYLSFKHQQSKIDELNQELHLVLNNWNDLTKVIHARTNGTAVAEARQLYEKVDELQKMVDAVKGLAQILWEKSEEKHHQGKVWESKTLGECADEILDVLEQAFKGCDRKTSQELSLSELRGNNV